MSTDRLSTNPLNGSSLLAKLQSFTARQGAPPLAIHSLHPYPAKYIPQLPAAILAENTNERHTVLDPFCGSGTTLVESALGGRASIGIDSNPVACLISRAKTTPLQEDSLDWARRFLECFDDLDAIELSTFHHQIIERQDKWFQQNMLDELSWLRSQCEAAPTPELATFLLCIFSSVVVLASNQDSETRYTAVTKHHPDGYALSRFQKKLAQSLISMEQFLAALPSSRNLPTVVHSGADAALRELDSSSVDLIITSPPYPNSFDYYLYHKLRIAWLGYDYKEVQRREIGSRYEHSSRKEPLSTFRRRVRPIMVELSRILKPAKLAYFFVGDSIIQGKHINMASFYRDLAEDVGFGFAGSTTYDMKSISRSFLDTREAAGASTGHKKLQRIVVLEGRRSLFHLGEPPRFGAKPLPTRQPERLTREIPSGTFLALKSNDHDRHVHSLAFFPSKFIPEIPRWALSTYGVYRARVLDPFGGSGTTAVEACLVGATADSIDISPYASLLTEAKTLEVSVELLEAETLRFLDVIKSPSKLPEAKRLRFERDNFWFNVEHLTEFARIKRFIASEIDPKLHAFFYAILASTVRRFSYQDESQIKVKRDAKKLLHGTSSPSDFLAARLTPAMTAARTFLAMRDRKSVVRAICRSADDFAKEQDRGAYDVIVTSPPYINAMNYPMANRYELVLLELISPDRLHEHERQYFGTERVYASEYNSLEQVPSSWPESTNLNRKLAQIFERERKRSFLVYKYFQAMHGALESVARLLRSDGYFIMVAGTNRIRDIPIDTAEILFSYLEECGLRRLNSFRYEIIKQRFKITRHKTAGLIAHDRVGVFVKP